MLWCSQRHHAVAKLQRNGERYWFSASRPSGHCDAIRVGVFFQNPQGKGMRHATFDDTSFDAVILYM